MSFPGSTTPLLELRLVWGCLQNEGPDRTSTVGSDWATSGSWSPRSIQKEEESVGASQERRAQGPSDLHRPLENRSPKVSSSGICLRVLADWALHLLSRAFFLRR